MTDNILCAAEFAALGQQIGLLGSLVDDMDLEGFQRTTQRAETIGPFLDPTACMNGGFENLRDQRELVAPLIEFQKAVRRVKARRSP